MQELGKGIRYLLDRQCELLQYDDGSEDDEGEELQWAFSSKMDSSLNSWTSDVGLLAMPSSMIISIAQFHPWSENSWTKSFFLLFFFFLTILLLLLPSSSFTLFADDDDDDDEVLCFVICLTLDVLVQLNHWVGGRDRGGETEEMAGGGIKAIKEWKVKRS